MSNARKLGNMTTHGLDGDFNVDPTDNTLVVDSTNNRVGIGSATPTTTLDITGTATATAFSGPLTGNVTGTTSSISNHDTDALSEGSTNLYFTNARADARAQLKIDALVDSAPGTLDTLNELAAALGDDASFSTTITNSIATKLPLAGGTLTGDLQAPGLYVGSTNNSFDFYNNGTTYLNGTTTIDDTLSVVGPSGTDVVQNIRNPSTSWSQYALTRYGSEGQDVRYMDFGYYRGSIEALRGLVIKSQANSSLVTFLDSGKVGIGETSPLGKLHVKDGDAGSITTNTAHDTVVIEGSGNTGINIFSPNTSYQYLAFGDTEGANSGYVRYQHSNNQMVLRTGGADTVYINDSKVGIGRTPESHYTGYTALDLGHSSSLFGNKTGSDTNVVILANNSYLNSTASAWKYIVTDEATKYEQSNGKHRWFHASSGTAGTDVTWTNSLAIDESGNVGIGTASPVKKLSIEDTGDVGISLRTTAANTNAEMWEITAGANSSSNADLTFRSRNDDGTGGSESLRLQYGGNVGIGTTSPDGKLTVALENSNTPAFRLASPTSSTDFAISNYNDANGTYVSMGVNHLFDVSGNDAVMDTNDKSAAIVLDGRNNGRIQFLTNSSGIATPRMTITQDGDVGIGATNPGGSRLYLQDTHTTAVTNAVTMIANTTLTINGNSSQGSDVMRMGPMSTSGKHFIDVSNSAGNAAYDLLLNPISGGNVGIGITNAAQLLHVQAGSTGNGTIRVGGGAGLEISHDNSSTTIQRIDSLYRTTSANANLQLRTGILTAHIGTASTEAMRLDGTNGLQVITDSSNGTTADNVSIRYNGTAGGHQSGYLFKDKRNVVNAAIKNDLQDDGVGTAAAHLRFQTSHGGTLTTQMTIDRYGQVMMPNQPSFRAYSTNDYTANGTLESANWTEQHDNNGDFSNGRFTAPVDGVYLFEVMWDANGSLGGLSLLKNTSYYLVRWEPTGLSTAGWESRHYSTTVKLSSGDYVRLVGVHASGSNPFHMGGGHWGFFSGHLLG